MEIGIQVYRSSADARQGLQFDVCYVMIRLMAHFPSIRFEEEYFQRQIDRIKTVLNAVGSGNALDIAIKDAEERGPGFRFYVDSPSGTSLSGGISRHNISFKVNEKTGPELKQAAIDFLESFSLQRYEIE